MLEMFIKDINEKNAWNFNVWNIYQRKYIQKLRKGSEKNVTLWALTL